MLTALRKELNCEHLPLIIGEISEDITKEWNVGSYPKPMNESFYEIAKELPNCAVASAKGLSLKKDGIHFDSKACREFGIRYFEKYKEVYFGE